jgi:proline iminopeptidase/L-proline amide hydrolase
MLSLTATAATLVAGRARAEAPADVPAPDRELRVPVTGGSVYVRVNGPLEGPRAPVLMIHGGPGGTHAGFLPALALASERAVVLYDQLDCGRSDTPGDPANWTVERFVTEVDAIRGALGLERLHVLGHSWGGTVATAYGAGRPKGLASLTLQGPLISTKVWIDDANRLRRTLPAGVRADLDRCERKLTPVTTCEAAERAFYKSFNALELPSAARQAYQKALPKPFNAKLYNYMWGPSEFRATGTLKDYDGEPGLRRIEAPALFLAGQYDEGTPAACRRFAAETPRAEVKVVPHAAHAIQNDRPEAWLAVLRDWFGRFD